jgi:5-methylcytosine-specific restriction endonuclease McrA
LVLGYPRKQFMFEPIPKPEKRGRKPPKPLKRTALKPSTKPLKRTPLKQSRKPIVIKIDEQWIIAKSKWFKLNSPDIDGEYYQCALCPYAIPKDEVTLDHIKPRSTHKAIRYFQYNLQPAHGGCNTRKGSMSMKAYEQTYGKNGCKLLTNQPIQW